MVLLNEKQQEEQVKRVRSSWQEKVNQLETQIQTKLDLAEARRQNIEKEQNEKFKEQVRTD